MLFDHDPLHDDEQLDRLHRETRERWAAAGLSPSELLIAAEIHELELGPAGAKAAAAGS